MNLHRSFTILPYSEDLTNVGKGTKAVGYLPLSTFKKNISPDVLISSIKEHDEYNCIKFTEKECQIRSGALFVWHKEKLAKFLKLNSAILKKACVPTTSLEYIIYIASNIVFSDLFPEAYAAVGRSFDDERFR